MIFFNRVILSLKELLMDTMSSFPNNVYKWKQPVKKNLKFIELMWKGFFFNASTCFEPVMYVHVGVKCVK